MERKLKRKTRPVWVLGGLCLVCAGCVLLWRYLSGRAPVTPSAAVGCVVVLACGVLMLRCEFRARKGENGEEGGGEP